MSHKRQIKRITFINQTLGIGGAEFSNLCLFDYLKSQGIEVFAWTTNDRFNQMLEKHHPRKIWAVVDIIGNWKGFVKGVILFPLAIMTYLGIIFRSVRSDLIFMTGFIEKIFVTPIARILNIPVVWVEYAPLNSILGKFFGIPGILYKYACRFPNHIIMPTQNTLRHNLLLTEIPVEKTSVIPCATQIKPQKSPHTIPGTVICVSRLEKGKGQDLLIRAWKNVSIQHPQATLYLIGEGAMLSSLKALVRDLGLVKSVFIQGWVSEVSTWLSRAQICVFPSTWALEGFGLGVTEAMSMSKPVVAFDYGPVKELIDGNTGILVEPSDVRKLSEAIIYILDHPQLGEKMGKAGKVRYDRYYSINVVGDQYRQIFNLAVNRVK